MFEDPKTILEQEREIQEYKSTAGKFTKKMTELLLSEGLDNLFEHIAESSEKPIWSL